MLFIICGVSLKPFVLYLGLACDLTWPELNLHSVTGICCFNHMCLSADVISVAWWLSLLSGRGATFLTLCSLEIKKLLHAWTLSDLTVHSSSITLVIVYEVSFVCLVHLNLKVLTRDGIIVIFENTCALKPLVVRFSSLRKPAVPRGDQERGLAEGGMGCECV